MPDLSKYQKFLRSWETSFEDIWSSNIYGGPVFKPTNVDFSSHKILNPLHHDLRSIKHTDLQDPSLFGYFLIKNIKMQEQNTLSTFVDFWILATSVTSQDDFDQLKSLHQQSLEIEKDLNNTMEYILDYANNNNYELDQVQNVLQMVEYVQFNDIKQFLNGYARSVWFYCDGKYNGVFSPMLNP